MAVIRGKANRSRAGMGIEKLGGNIKGRDDHEQAQRARKYGGEIPGERNYNRRL
jgi:hypothetical protein